jgi:hypothetical protein
MELPLIFYPIDYRLAEFLKFFLLIGFFSFLLVYITLPVLNSLKPIKQKLKRYEGFFIIGSFIALQAVTMLTGYIESSLIRGVNADTLYYYKGVSNSLIYIVTGNITSLLAASLYAAAQWKLEKEKNAMELSL